MDILKERSREVKNGARGRKLREKVGQQLLKVEGESFCMISGIKLSEVSMIFCRYRLEKSFAQRVDEAISRSIALVPLLPTRITSRLPPSEALKIEDSEAWLSLDEQGFEEMLQSRGPGMGGLDDLDDEEFSSDDDDDDAMEGVEESKDSMERKEERKAKKIAKQMEGMAEKVEEFVQGRGAVDGAEFSE